MRRWEQENVNDVAMMIYHDGMKQLQEKGSWHGYERLYHCQAHIVHTDDYVFLVSYDTIVAVFEKSTGFLADVLRVVYGYTATSAKHIAKFRHILPVVREYTARR